MVGWLVLGEGLRRLAGWMHGGCMGGGRGVGSERELFLGLRMFSETSRIPLIFFFGISFEPIAPNQLSHPCRRSNLYSKRTR